MRDDVIAVGVILLIIGAVAYLYPQQATVFGYTYTVGYPYQGLGTGLILLAFVAFIVGAAMPKQPSKPATKTSNPPSSTTTVANADFCTKCGQMLRPSDIFCPRCGTAKSS